MDWKEAIDRYDGTKTLFYLDPPYLNAEHKYEVRFRNDEHAQLRARLRSVKGAWIASYGDDALVRALYKECVIIEKDIVYHIAREGAPKARSLLIMPHNYLPQGPCAP
jgi:DNA adenine methylase